MVFPIKSSALKKYNEEGFIFYTNYNSSKRKQSKKSKCLLFFGMPWSDKLLEGIAKKVPQPF
jgi:pyridoxamine 5'-phosphate oxidase